MKLPQDYEIFQLRSNIIELQFNEDGHGRRVFAWETMFRDWAKNHPDFERELSFPMTKNDGTHRQVWQEEFKSSVPMSEFQALAERFHV
jgi:hypothetical protein